MNVDQQAEEAMPVPETVAPVIAEPVVAAELSVGAELKQAREARGASMADVALALRIGERQVQAIEAEHWEALPGAPFVRGFVRNYARWLGLDKDALVSRIQLGAMAAAPALDLRSSTDATLPQSGDLPRRDFLTLGLGVLVIALAMAAYFLMPADFWNLPGQEAAPPAAVTEVAKPADMATAAPGVTPATAAGDPAAAPAAGTGVASGNDGAAAGLAPAPGTALPASPVPASPTLPAVAAGDSRAEPTAALAAAAASADKAGAPVLELSFVARSWVEVRDRQGTLILSDSVGAGESRQFSGSGPFLVVIGRADAVKVRYKGRLIELAPHSRKNIARLTLE